MILAIDPGSTGLGPACAYFNDDGKLAHVCFSFRPGGAGLTDIVVEQWQFRGQQDVPVASRMIKMLTAGLLAAGHALGQAEPDANLHLYTPKEWKGEEPKPMHHDRMWCKLDAAERRVLGGDRTYAVIRAAVREGALTRWGRRGVDYYPKNFDTHNLLDAAALGCFQLGRLGKR